MGAKVAAGAIAFLLVGALMLIGVASAAFAIHLGLSALGEAWSWAITALILLLGPCMFMLGMLLRRPPPSPARNALFGVLGGMAAETPIAGLVLAGVLAAV